MAATSRLTSCLVAACLLFIGEAVAAQASPCGLPDPLGAGIEVTLAEIAARAAQDPERERIAESASLLRAWLTECDGAAGRNAARALSSARGDVARLMRAVALARGPDVYRSRPGGTVYRFVQQHTNAETQARRVFVEQAKEHASVTAARELAVLALASRNTETLKAAQESIRRIELDAGSADVARLVAEVALARGDTTATARLAAEALTFGNTDAGRVAGMARLLRGAGAPSDAAEYLEYLQGATGVLLATYFDDIAILLHEWERQEYAALDEPARRAWIRQQWEWRSALAGVTVAERLRTHHTRLLHALSHYQRMATAGARPVDAMARDSALDWLPLDDRGLLYVRHGPPLHIARGSARTVQRETWYYPMVSGERVAFDFMRADDWPDWRANQGLQCDPFIYMVGVGGIVGRQRYISDPRNIENDWQGGFERAHLDMASELAGRIPSIAHDGRSCAQGVIRTLRQPDPTAALVDFMRTQELRNVEIAARARQQYHVAMTTESAVDPSPTPLDVLLRSYAFRAAGGATLLTAYAIIPAGSLHADRSRGTFDYALVSSLNVVHEPTRRTFTVDTVVSYSAPSQLPAEAVMRVTLGVQTTGIEDALVGIGFTNPAERDQRQAATFRRNIPDFSGDAVNISDIVIADTLPGSFTRGAESLLPLPGHIIAAGARFRMFVEAYNLDDDAPIRISVTIAPGRSEGVMSRLRELIDRREAMSLSYEDVAQPEDGVVAIATDVGAELEPGRYVLRLALTDLRSGTTVHRETALEVR